MTEPTSSQIVVTVFEQPRAGKAVIFKQKNLSHCKPYERLHVRTGDEDELGSFVFRTTGFNSIRTLTTRMKYYQAVSGNRLASMKLELRLRGKSTTQSHRAPIY